MPFHHFNVQSATLRPPFWTSSCLSATSTSNLQHFGFLFGLPRAFPPLQRPIRHTSASFLDFLVPSSYFNVQSAAPPAQFWTSSCLPATSTSNSPRRQHRDLRKATTHQLIWRISSHGASAHTTYQLTRRISSHDTSARMTHILTLQPFTLTYSAVPQTAHRPSVEYPSL